MDFSKIQEDIIHCHDTANVIQNVKRGIEYVVQVPAEYRAGLEAGKYTVLAGKDGRQWATVYEGLLFRSFNFAMIDTNNTTSILDHIWLEGIQRELSELVALLLYEPTEVHSKVSQSGYKYFTSEEDFKAYVRAHYLS